MIETTRRLFLKAIAGLTSLPVLDHNRWIVAAAPVEHTGKLQVLISHEIMTLKLMAYQLFPHDGLSADVYQELATNLAERAKKDQTILVLIRSGIQSLDTTSNSLWVNLSQEQQLDQLIRIVDTEFFKYMRHATIEYLYRDPRVWRKLSYAGSSIEFGGYINRGFNDIDWLP